MSNNELSNTDLVTIVDENGVTHVFEELDRIETEDGRFVALLPLDESDDDEDSELIVLQVREDGDEVWLEPIEDDKVFEDVAEIFEDRLSEQFDFADEEE
ncbi:MAG: DUF1292 domain-containing protein [Oscillospiraceae bacterium]|nr:DUF1292 domain-containing protein [Oscillospiraceae bacterium]